MNHSHHKYSLGAGSNDTVALRARTTFGSRSSSPAANAIKVAAAFGPHSASPAHTSNGLHANANGHATHSSTASTSGSAGIWSTSIEEAASTTKNTKDFGQSHSCCYHCHKHNFAVASSEYSDNHQENTAMINGSSGGIQTIEDQIRAVDKVIKVCYFFVFDFNYIN